MIRIHATTCETTGGFGASGKYVKGVNIASFIKVAKAMVTLGLI